MHSPQPPIRVPIGTKAKEMFRAMDGAEVQLLLDPRGFPGLWGGVGGGVGERG